LLFGHWREVAHFDDIPLAPARDVYLASADAGIIRCCVARDGGAMVGYAVFFVRPNPHYATSVQAVQDVFYLDPQLRGVTGVRFLQFCEAELRAEGVQVMYHHAKVAPHLPMGRILARLGYEPVDTIFAKRLDTVAPETAAVSSVEEPEHIEGYYEWAAP
jgi:hypothetical protein